MVQVDILSGFLSTHVFFKIKIVGQWVILGTPGWIYDL